MKARPIEPWMTVRALFWRRGIDCIWAAMLRAHTRKIKHGGVH
jgi:hypothetical protein